MVVKLMENEKRGFIVKVTQFPDYAEGTEIRELMLSAYTPDGWYIGSVDAAARLVKLGIIPERKTKDSGVCSIGVSYINNRWYGWSHRAIASFGIGDVVNDGDCTASSGMTPEAEKQFPEENVSLPVGFEAKTMEDAKKMAIAFAESVS